MVCASRMMKTHARAMVASILSRKYTTLVSTLPSTTGGPQVGTRLVVTEAQEAEQPGGTLTCRYCVDNV